MDHASPVQLEHVLQDFIHKRDFGYTHLPDELYHQIRLWFQKRHQFDLKTQDIIPISGVVCGIYAFLEAFLSRREAYLTFTPAYPLFLQPHHYRHIPLIEVPLTYQNEEPMVDFTRLKNSITPKTKVFLISNPHNPTGKVWSKDELHELINLCEHHDLMLISDDIWCDLTMTSKQYTPILTCHPKAANRAIILSSPAKTFNIPALNCAYFLTKNDALNQYLRKMTTGITPPVSPLSVLATIEAYQNCEAWFDDTKKKLLECKRHIEAVFRKKYPHFKIYSSDATFLLWIDFSFLKGKIPITPYEFFLKEAKIAFNDGRVFGKGFEYHARLNYACEKKTLEEVIKRMDFALEKI